MFFYFFYFFVETKAYQLLKQSVTQENQWKNAQEEEEEEDGSDLETSGTDLAALFWKTIELIYTILSSDFHTLVILGFPRCWKKQYGT